MLPNGFLNHMVLTNDISGFYVFVVAKPVEFSDLEGVWCPLKLFKRGWDGKTTYNAASGTWLDDEDNYEMHDLKEIPTFLPTWSGKAVIINRPNGGI